MITFNNIKNKSESYAKLMRDNFPNSFENPKINSFLNEYVSNDEKSIFVEEIIKQNKINEFKSFVNSKIGNNKLGGDVDTGKSVKDLFNEAGYDFHITKTKAEVENFKDYYKDGEKLCTFNNISGRLSDFNVFWITKKNIDDVKRNSNPSRQDEYGTSCCSIQISKNGDYISIKNRYNHTVSNPDNTFSNNLENIIPGLNKAFLKDFNINLKTKQGEDNFELNNFIETNDGLMYFNFERDNIYFGINKTANRGVITTYDKDKYLLADNFLINKSTKQAKNILDSNDFFILGYNNGDINIKTDKRNRIIELNSNIENIGYGFLRYNTSLKEIDLPNVENIGDKFLFNNTSLEKIDLPNIKEIGDYFLYNNKSIININLPNVENIGNDFLYNNTSLEKIDLSNLKNIGYGFLTYNTSLEKIVLPNVKEIGKNFLYNNTSLENIDLPNLEKIGNNFLYYNNSLENIDLQNIKEIGDYFIYYNKSIIKINLPNVKEIGNDFLYNNTSIIKIDLSNLKNIGYGFLRYNTSLKEIDLSNVENIGDNFLYYNKSLENIDLPNLENILNDFLANNKNIENIILPNVKNIGDNFLYNNKSLENIDLPNVKKIGDNFLYNNTSLEKINLPNIKKIGDNFLYNNKSIININLPNVKEIGKNFLYYNKSLEKIKKDLFVIKYSI